MKMFVKATREAVRTVDDMGSVDDDSMEKPFTKYRMFTLPRSKRKQVDSKIEDLVQASSAQPKWESEAIRIVEDIGSVDDDSMGKPFTKYRMFTLPRSKRKQFDSKIEDLVQASITQPKWESESALDTASISKSSEDKPVRKSGSQVELPMSENGKGRRQRSATLTSPRRDGLSKSQLRNRTLSSNRRSQDDLTTTAAKKSDRAVGPKQRSLLGPCLSSSRGPSYRHSNSANDLTGSDCVLQSSNRSLRNSSSVGELGDYSQAGRRCGSARRELSMSEHGKGRRQRSTQPATLTSRRDGLSKSEHHVGGRQRSTRSLSSNRRSPDDLATAAKKSDRAVGPKQRSLLSRNLSSSRRRPSYRHSSSVSDLAGSDCVLQRSNHSLRNSSSAVELGECDKAGRRGSAKRPSGRRDEDRERCNSAGSSEGLGLRATGPLIKNEKKVGAAELRGFVMCDLGCNSEHRGSFTRPSDHRSSSYCRSESHTRSSTNRSSMLPKPCSGSPRSESSAKSSRPRLPPSGSSPQERSRKRQERVVRSDEGSPRSVEKVPMSPRTPKRSNSGSRFRLSALHRAHNRNNVVAELMDDYASEQEKKDKSDPDKLKIKLFRTEDALADIPKQKTADLQQMREEFEKEKILVAFEMQKKFEAKQKQQEIEQLILNRDAERFIGILEQEKKELEATKSGMLEGLIAGMLEENQKLELANEDIFTMYKSLNDFAVKKTGQNKKLRAAEEQLKTIYKGAMHLKNEAKMKKVYRGCLYKCARGVHESDLYDHDLNQFVKRAIRSCESELGCKAVDFTNLGEEDFEAEELLAEPEDQVWETNQDKSDAVDDVEPLDQEDNGEIDTHIDELNKGIADYSEALGKVTSMLDETQMSTLFENKEMMLTIFKFLDTDGSGTIDIEEFRLGIDLLNRRLPITSHFKDHVELFKALDLDNNGSIDIEEFNLFFTESDKNAVSS